MNLETEIKSKVAGLDTIKCKRRKDIESRYPEMEHLWFKVEGRNRHSNLLIRTVYISTLMLGTKEWLTQLENMLSELTISWDGLLVLTGDMNIDILHGPSTALAKQYLDLLETFNLTQHVVKPTRVTATSKTLVDHSV